MKLEEITVSSLAKMIDHSLLHPSLTDHDLKTGCAVANKWETATVCVKPYAVESAKNLLLGSPVKVTTVVSFPHGNSSTNTKIRETIAAMKEGAVEIDMVVNIGKVLSEDWPYVSQEIKEINDIVRSAGGLLKVIFENDFLQDNHILHLCEVCSEQSVAFVKTSTGFGFVKQPNGCYAYKGATAHHISLMRKTCPPNIQVKAAGGIRSLDQFLAMKELGVTRIGATATESILSEAVNKGCINDLPSLNHQ
ncbi:MAG: deoxyribose-phosphate aldolase [Candidatus Aminicenantes bacterium]|nr:deoxyribose-phosphate aldolase [Candidatus Aminicenantes bacterium]